jgi:hypothetical protein
MCNATQLYTAVFLVMKTFIGGSLKEKKAFVLKPIYGFILKVLISIKIRLEETSLVQGYCTFIRLNKKKHDHHNHEHPIQPFVIRRKLKGWKSSFLSRSYEIIAAAAFKFKPNYPHFTIYPGWLVG